MSAPQRVDRVSLPVCQHQPRPYDGPPAADLRAARREFLNPALFHLYAEPLCVVEGHMQYVWDDAGRRYLDGYSGIATVSVGHAHPKVTERLRGQVGRLTHLPTVYLHPNRVELAEVLARRMPAGSGLTQSYFVNSGGEANDMAILLARTHTRRQDVIALRNAYHGALALPMALTSIPNWRYPAAQVANVFHAPEPYCYRCPFGLPYPSCEMRCAKAVAHTIKTETSGEIAAFIAEPMQGIGGVVAPPLEYFKIVYDTVRAHGGLCVADEVQTGVARLGEAFWGFEYYGVTPDIVTIAKGIANGSPLGACVARPEVAASLAQRLHFNTFGGNPVSTAAALATLEAIEDDGLQANAREVGGHLRGRLLELQERHQWIGDVRGAGLLIGVELVRDRTREPALVETARVLELARERGLLLGKGGMYGNVLRVKPPLCVSRDDCDFLADCLDECLAMLRE